EGRRRERERDKQMGQITSVNLEWRWNGPAGCLSQKTGNDDAHAISRSESAILLQMSEAPNEDRIAMSWDVSCYEVEHGSPMRTRSRNSLSQRNLPMVILNHHPSEPQGGQIHLKLHINAGLTLQVQRGHEKHIFRVEVSGDAWQERHTTDILQKEDQPKNQPPFRKNRISQNI
ncbi:hypothetical protein J6590_100586, partial [Homalodisca vitripennis]